MHQASLHFTVREFVQKLSTAEIHPPIALRCRTIQVSFFRPLCFHQGRDRELKKRQENQSSKVRSQSIASYRETEILRQLRFWEISIIHRSFKSVGRLSRNIFAQVMRPPKVLCFSRLRAAIFDLRPLIALTCN